MNKALALNALDQKEEALNGFIKVIDLINEGRTISKYSERKTQILKEFERGFNWGIVLGFKLCKLEDVFYILENTRSVDLIDLLRRRDIPLICAENKELAREYQKVLDRIRELQENLDIEWESDISTGTRALSRSHHKKQNRITQEIRPLLEKRKEMFEELKFKNPMMASIQEPLKFDINEFTRNANEYFNKKTWCSLSYWFDELSAMYILYTDNEAHIRSMKVNISKYDIGKIENLCGKTDRMLSEFEERTKPEILAAYRHLIPAPFRKDIFSKDILIVNPWGMLHFMPFASLLDENEVFLCQKLKLLRTQGLASLELSLKDRKGQNKGAFLLGDPAYKKKSDLLKFSGMELENIKKTCDRKGDDIQGPFIGDNASVKVLLEENYKGRLSEKRLIHLSSHAGFDKNEPLDSAIELCDGKLTVDQLFQFKADSELFTISACESGLSEISTGDELLGFSKGLLFAGARSLLLSLWKVDDQATYEFMKRFYVRYAEHDDKLLALQEAQMDFIKGSVELDGDKDCRHPKYWAAFFITGAP